MIRYNTKGAKEKFSANFLINLSWVLSRDKIKKIPISGIKLDRISMFSVKFLVIIY